MKILLLNTCGAEGSLALADTALLQPVLALSRLPGRMAAEKLVPALRAAMGNAGWTLRDLSAIAVVTGPGSFTGVRVGLSVAKGLSEASGVPMIAVSRLAMLAAAVAGPEPGSLVCALLDAGRNEFYCGWTSREFPEILVSQDAAVAVALKADISVVCEVAVARVLEGIVQFRLVEDPTAADALPFALRKLESATFDDAMTLDANYLRRTDAEIFSPTVAASHGGAQPTLQKGV